MSSFATLQWLSSLLFLGVLVLGTVVTVQAVRAYRRSGDETMRYFAVGLGLVLVASPLLGLVGELAEVTVDSVGLEAVMGLLALEHGVEFLGVCALVYALYAKRRV